MIDRLVLEQKWNIVHEMIDVDAAAAVLHAVGAEGEADYLHVAVARLREEIAIESARQMEVIETPGTAKKHGV